MLLNPTLLWRSTFQVGKDNITDRVTLDLLSHIMQSHCTTNFGQKTSLDTVCLVILAGHVELWVFTSLLCLPQRAQ
jgi:hypothetical protein